MKISETNNLPDAPPKLSAPNSKLADAAQEFEALMLKEFLKPLSNSDDRLGPDENKDDTFDTLSSFGVEAVAKEIAAKGGLGIANHIITHPSRPTGNENISVTKVSSPAADTFK
jgi:Rod binding domain-containing protein